MTSTSSAPGEGATMTITYQPGTLTPEKSLEISRAFVALMNAMANDVDPNAGEFYKVTDMKWVDDGNDTITLRFGNPAAKESAE